MSWDNNPYKNMELEFEKDDGEMVRWSCHNCGGVGQVWYIARTVKVEDIRHDWLVHVRRSHRLHRAEAAMQYEH